MKKLQMKQTIMHGPLTVYLSEGLRLSGESLPSVTGKGRPGEEKGPG